MPADAAWTQRFREHVRDLPESLGSPTTSHEQAAERLRGLIRSGLVRHTEVRDDAERFFCAHRILSEYATRLGPGFGIRFTVQFNLFAGTITALGGPGELPIACGRASRACHASSMQAPCKRALHVRG
jgi:acyl-CoA oxidase